jgi:hypothetical protein
MSLAYPLRIMYDLIRNASRVENILIDPTIACPHCKADIHLTESLAGPLLAAAQENFQRQLKEKDEYIIARENAVRTQEKNISDEKRAIDDTIADKVTAQLQLDRDQISRDEAKKAKQAASLEIDAEKKKLADTEALLKAHEIKLTQAQAVQAEFLKKQRELDEQKRELDLTVEKRINDGLVKVQETTRKHVEEQEKLKTAEKDAKIEGLTKQIDILKQKAEQGSQQLQGEVLELELEMLLRQGFPMDGVDPVPKGEFGGDVLHRVLNPTGQHCGTILWESKRTRNWSDGWLVKLRSDQRMAKAELSVLVSQALPVGVEIFDIVDNVWVVSPRAIVPIATALRHSLHQLNTARQSSEGQQTKTELVYQYLTGPQFRQRVEAIVEAFSSMREDLNKERQVIMKQWAKREKQIENVMTATVGMWGDLQGISGKSLAELEGLELVDYDKKDLRHHPQASLPGLA